MIQYAFKKKCSERITYSEPILKKVSIGQKPRFWQRKNPENQWFSGFFGGDKRDRTADLLNAIQALSQLSYTPIFGSLSDSFRIIATQLGFVKRDFIFFIREEAIPVICRLLMWGRRRHRPEWPQYYLRRFRSPLSIAERLQSIRRPMRESRYRKPR